MPRMMRSSSTPSSLTSQRLDGLAVADDGDGVGDLLDLVELVADHDAGDALGAQTRDEVEQVLRVALVEGGGRLVEDEQLDVLGRAPWRSRRAAACRRRCRLIWVSGSSSRPTRASSSRALALGGEPVDDAALGRLVAEEDVLGDRHLRDERELLVDDDDAGVLAVADVVELDELGPRSGSRRRRCRAGWTPERTFIRVDLPAPFSPQIAWTSPRRTAIETFESALTPGNSLVMSRISRMTLPGGPAGCAAAPVVSALDDPGAGMEGLLIWSSTLLCGVREAHAPVPIVPHGSCSGGRTPRRVCHKDVTISGRGPPRRPAGSLNPSSGTSVKSVTASCPVRTGADRPAPTAACTRAADILPRFRAPARRSGRARPSTPEESRWPCTCRPCSCEPFARTRRTQRSRATACSSAPATSAASAPASTRGCRSACACCATSRGSSARRWTPSAPRSCSSPRCCPRSPSRRAAAGPSTATTSSGSRTARAPTTCSARPTRRCSPSRSRTSTAPTRTCRSRSTRSRRSTATRRVRVPACCAAASSS